MEVKTWISLTNEAFRGYFSGHKSAGKTEIGCEREGSVLGICNANKQKRTKRTDRVSNEDMIGEKENRTL